MVSHAQNELVIKMDYSSGCDTRYIEDISVYLLKCSVNCALCSSGSNCKTCISGYTLEANGSCIL